MQPADLLEEFIQDIISRNDSMISYQNMLIQSYADKPLNEIESLLKSAIEENRIYRGFTNDNRNPANDFELMEQETPSTIVQKYYRDDEHVKKYTQSFIDRKNIINSADYLTDEQKALKMRTAKIMLNLKLKSFYKDLPEEDKEKHKKDHYKEILSGIEAEVENRRIVQMEFNQNKSDDEIMVFDEERDKGCCTKSLSVSLYKLQEKYGLDIFEELEDIENIAHPKDLKGKLKNYIRTSESGNLEDIEIKRGDIIMLTTSQGEPGHAMLCYDFDEETKEPLLLGFSNITNKVKSNKNEFGGSRRGIVLDVNRLIQDTYQNLVKSKSRQQSVSGYER